MKLCGFDAGLEHPLFLIAGPCVVESEQLQVDVAGHLKEITAALGVPFIFKSSYDKANRTSAGRRAALAWRRDWRCWPRCGSGITARC